MYKRQVQQKAKSLDLEPQVYVDKVSKEFRRLTKYLNCSNNDFIRTTEKRHFRNVHSLWKKLLENGDIYLDQYSGWYSIVDEAFYNDEEITKSENNVMISPNGNTVEWINEQSYFFRLSKYQNKLIDFYEKNVFLKTKIIDFSEISLIKKKPVSYTHLTLPTNVQV